MAKRVRVVSGTSTTPPVPVGRPKVQVVAVDEGPRASNQRLTDNERLARRMYATTTSGMRGRTAGDTADTGQFQFYSPQLSTDFLEKPQNLRERRAFYRFFYNTNEIIGQAIDIHSTLPLSKLRLVPPKGKNKHQNEYVFKFFQGMCDDMKLFKTLIEITHEYFLMGNCLAPYADVAVLGGRKKAEDIRAGDMVLTDAGRYRRVVWAGSRPSEQLLHIRCWKDFRELPVTEEHPIEILRDEVFFFEQAGNVHLNDYVRVTWPEEVEDREVTELKFPEEYEKIDGGYVLNFKISHPMNPDAAKARKGLIEWLGSLTEPVIKARADIANDIGVPLSTLHNVINTVQKELGKEFHRRIGPSGWQKGSKVEWVPTDTSIIKAGDSYDIRVEIFLGAVDKVKLDEDFMYLLGYWLGDGTLARDSSREDHWGRGLWQISAKFDEKENIDRVRNILVKMFGTEAITEWTSNDMTYLKVISNPAFIEWWAENFGETSFGKNNKRIPDWIVKMPTIKLQHMLAGLIDSDGCVSVTGPKRHCCVSVGMTSQVMMNSVRDICLKCGIVNSYTRDKERDGYLPNGKLDHKREIYTVKASDEESCVKFSEYSNKCIPEDAHFPDDERYWKRVDGKIAYKVKSIKTEESYNDLVYNFEVEEDHTYQVAGFSTHNCACYAEENNWKEGLNDFDVNRKAEEARQRSEYLQQKFQIVDKNPLYKGWRKILVLPPDQIRIRKLPLTDDVAIEYMPDPETRRFLTSDVPFDPNDPARPIKNTVPEEIKDKIRITGTIPMDTDPNTGSHVYLLTRKKSQYEPLGVSIIERCVNTLTLMDKLRQAQTSIASRHMTPMRIVWAEKLNDDQVDELREQVDMAIIDPDFSIVANYEIHWEEMGSQGRLLDIEAENESAMNRLFAGLGVTREILTGEGTYTGSRISLEIMNNMYLMYREVIQDYVENYIFKPVARKKGFIEYDEYGNEVLLYPKLSFTRLAIRDNEQYFDAAFQLYQKGSISIDLILDILNVDPDSTREKLEKDIFTVNDSLFNEVLRNVYTNVAAPLVEKTDITQKLADYLKLKMTEEPPAEAEGASRFSSMDADKRAKLAKVVQYLSNNPAALEKVFATREKPKNE